nr:MAG TPA: hypothetical protein [Caudoviricetes sp.]
MSLARAFIVLSFVFLPLFWHRNFAGFSILFTPFVLPVGTLQCHYSQFSEHCQWFSGILLLIFGTLFAIMRLQKGGE